MPEYSAENKRTISASAADAGNAATPAASATPATPAASSGRNGTGSHQRDNRNIDKRKIRRPGRISQTMICLGKLLRIFVYENDWKVFPVAAIIAGLIAYVLRTDLFLTMEGTLKGAYALSCVAVWNGCFNSIQVICRERPVLKREHRSGLHMSSYIAAHMIYQALLCLGQTLLILYVFRLVRLQYPTQGFITKWFPIDLGITIFLITYAADMLSLLISALVRNPVTAMTIMPFVIIFQLVFAGGILQLPDWGEVISNFTITHQGMTAMCRLADYNNLPMVTGWNALSALKNNEIGGRITIEEILAMLREKEANSSMLKEISNTEIIKEMTLEEVLNLLADDPKLEPLRRKKIASLFTVSDVVSVIRDMDLPESILQTRIGKTITIGQVLDFIENDPDLETIRTTELSMSMTVGQMIDMFGEDQLRELLVTKTAAVSRNDEFNQTREGLVTCWFLLFVFAIAYAFIAIILLEFIDRDRG